MSKTMICDRCETMHEFGDVVCSSCSCGGSYQDVNITMLFVKMLKIQEQTNTILRKMTVKEKGSEGTK